MIALLQRVTDADVTVGGKTVGEIGRGLLVLVGIERGDGEVQADRLLNRMLGYRVFPDEVGRMNLSLRDIGGGLLLVPQFTLVADTRKGMRPGFTPAATIEEGRRLFDYLCTRAHGLHSDVAAGYFGTDMRVSLVNDGPVTFWLQVSPTDLD